LRYSNYTAIPQEEPPSSEPPSFLTSDGYTEAWYIANSANLTVDGSNYITQWNDLSGNTTISLTLPEQIYHYGYLGVH